MSLTWCQNWFWHKWRKRVGLQLLFHFIVLKGIKASVLGMKIFMLCFRFQIEVFSYCTLTETFAIGFQKWFDHEWIDFGVFCSKMASFVDSISLRTEICINCSIVILFDDIDFFRCLVWGYFGPFLKMLALFSERILQYWLRAFRNAMQLYFLSFCVNQLFFREVVVKLFDYFWNQKRLFWKFYVICLLMFYFVY